MAKFIVIAGPVDHDGKVYVDGDKITLPDDAGNRLLAAGVVEPAAAPKAPAQGE